MWFLWSKPSNYQEKLICHASDERRNRLRRKRKVENRAVQCSGRPKFSLLGEAFVDPVRRVPPYEIFVPMKNFFCPFPFFQRTGTRICRVICTQIRRRGNIVPPPLLTQTHILSKPIHHPLCMNSEMA